MKLEIAHKDLIFTVLGKGYKLDDCTKRESWESEQDEEIERLKRVAGIRYSQIELPEPLKSAGFIARKNPSSYSALVYLVSRDPFAFKNKSSPFDKHVSGKKDRRFIDTTPNLTGHILDAKGIPVISIMEEGDKGQVREIAIGVDGACPREFKSKMSFNTDLKELEETVNEAITVILDNQVVNPKFIEEGLVLYLTP